MYSTGLGEVKRTVSFWKAVEAAQQSASTPPPLVPSGMPPMGNTPTIINTTPGQPTPPIPTVPLPPVRPDSPVQPPTFTPPPVQAAPPAPGLPPIIVTGGGTPVWGGGGGGASFAPLPGREEQAPSRASLGLAGGMLVALLALPLLLRKR